MTFSFAGGAATELASRLRDGFKIPFDGVGIPVRFVGSLLAGCGSFELVSPKTFLSILKISFKILSFKKWQKDLETRILGAIKFELVLDLLGILSYSR